MHSLHFVQNDSHGLHFVHQKRSLAQPEFRPSITERTPAREVRSGGALSGCRCSRVALEREADGAVAMKG